MRHGNAIAITLAAIAVVTAGAGTAVAVTSTTTISDGVVAGRKAHVDGYGRLMVVGQTTIGTGTTINAVTSQFPASTELVQPILSPTTATLGVTELVYNNIYNLSLANNNFMVSLVKINPGAAGNCYDSDRTVTYLRRDGVQQGDSMNSSLAIPILVKPTGTNKYCLGTIVRFAGPTAGSSYALQVTIGAYVAGGTYSGFGLSTSASAKVTPRLHRNR